MAADTQNQMHLSRQLAHVVDILRDPVRGQSACSRHMVVIEVVLSEALDRCVPCMFDGATDFQGQSVPLAS